jgi:hypothetical protein
VTRAGLLGHSLLLRCGVHALIPLCSTTSAL